jgi:hypothetical protein
LRASIWPSRFWMIRDSWSAMVERSKTHRACNLRRNFGSNLGGSSSWKRPKGVRDQEQSAPDEVGGSAWSGTAARGPTTRTTTACFELVCSMLLTGWCSERCMISMISWWPCESTHLPCPWLLTGWGGWGGGSDPFALDICANRALQSLPMHTIRCQSLRVPIQRAMGRRWECVTPRSAAEVAHVHPACGPSPHPAAAFLCARPSAAHSHSHSHSHPQRCHHRSPFLATLAPGLGPSGPLKAESTRASPG